jgi:nitrite reductase/ring-hydroxylating ferredoxin subunit/uncharacterized membrane protein
MANPMLERLEQGTQTIINTILGARGQGRHPLKSLLNGSWLGHPLHPLITDVALGGTVLTAVFDVIWLAFPVTHVWAPRAAEGTLVAGVIGMLGAAITGLADWSDTYGNERTTGLVHGLLNVAALAAYIISLVLRLLVSDAQSVVAAIVGFAGLALIATAAYFGGDLVFKFGTNVNHTAWEQGSEDFETVMPLADVPDHQLTRVTVAGVPVILLRQGEQLAAIAATCTHAGGPLDEGTLQGDVVRCPWHGSRFHVSTGKIVDGPATVSAPQYDIKVLDGQVALKRR